MGSTSTSMTSSLPWCSPPHSDPGTPRQPQRLEGHSGSLRSHPRWVSVLVSPHHFAQQAGACSGLSPL